MLEGNLAAQACSVMQSENQVLLPYVPIVFPTIQRESTSLMLSDVQ